MDIGDGRSAIAMEDRDNGYRIGHRMRDRMSHRIVHRR
jgi:hypothetical protein